jgi:lipopolysaccharide/colanic/teichoic acid biosynthesis glycosyltransferase
LFWQQRPGVGKKPFRVYKFRTMRGAFDWHGRRVVDEQRSSTIGRILRRTRLDELPQLINILRGQMSFVGPRPLLQVDQCTSTATRLLIRPGLTGWAQVNGGRLLSIPDKMALDLWYVQHASFAVDCKVIARTVAMVVFGEKRNDAEVRRANLWLKSRTSPAIPPMPLKPIAGQTNAAPIPFDINKRQVA